MDPVMIPLIAVVLGVPAIAFSTRALLKPLLDAWVRTREIKAREGAPVIQGDPEQARRIARLEAEVSSMREEMGRLAEVERFYGQLQAPAGSGSTTAPASLPRDAFIQDHA